MSYIWPIALVVVSNVVYQICAKGVHKDMDTMARQYSVHCAECISSVCVNCGWRLALP